MSTIGLVLDFSNPRLLEGAQAYCEKHQLWLDTRWSARGDWLPATPNWQGLIYGVIDMPPLLKRLENWKIPKVSLFQDDTCAIEIVPDHHACGVLAGKALIKMGIHELYVNHFTKDIVDDDFVKGVESTAKLANMPYEIIEPSGDLPFYERISCLAQTIKQQQHFVGLCSSTYGSAYSFQNAITRLGMRIPQDLTMCALDIRSQHSFSPAPIPISTVNLDERRRGYLAAEKVARIMRGKSPSEELIIVPPLGMSHRESTGSLDKRDPVLEKALTFIRKNHLLPIGVNDVTKAVGASRRSLETRFREALNCSVHEELTRLRIKQVIRMLSDKKLSITEIAEACGYSSLHYFSAAFKRETGFSPKAYQKNLE